MNYLKSIISYNNAKFNLNNFYSFRKDQENSIHASNQQASLIIKHVFQKGLISKPHFIVQHNLVIINVLYYTSKRFDKYPKEFFIDSLGKTLKDKCYGSHHIQLRLIKLNYPYLDSYILSKYIAYNAEKHSFRKIRNRFINKIVLFKDSAVKVTTGHLTGIKIDVAGRLASQRIKPRTASHTTAQGSFKHNSHKSIIDKSSCTDKNNMGAFTIKVWLSQKI